MGTTTQDLADQIKDLREKQEWLARSLRDLAEVVRQDDFSRNRHSGTNIQGTVNQIIEDFNKRF